MKLLAAILIAGFMLTASMPKLTHEKEFVSITKNLEAKDAQLSSSLTELSMAGKALQVSISEASNIKSQLDLAQTELDITRTESSSLKSQLNLIHEDLDAARAESAKLKSQLNLIQADLVNTKFKLIAAETELNTTESKLRLYRETSGVNISSGIQPPYHKSSNLQLGIVNNPYAVDPTWQEVKNFLLADDTDKLAYNPESFRCGEFAERVQKNAAASGIRAAIVILHFKDGTKLHALNAFKTIDKGLVYVDSTGAFVPAQQSYISLAPIRGIGESFTAPKIGDKIAYISKDKEFGLLSIDDVDSSFDYDSYINLHKKIKEDWSRYEDMVRLYNSEMKSLNEEIGQFKDEVSGKKYQTGTAELLRIQQWHISLASRENEVDKMRELISNFKSKLPTLWDQGSVVSSIEIYW